MGWEVVGREIVTGFSYEDEQVFRVLFDSNFLNKPDLPENHVALSLVSRGPARGKFIVMKLDKDEMSKPIPFSKAELVELMNWRVYVGQLGMVSSRMHRENIRRLEFQDSISAMGFKTLSL